MTVLPFHSSTAVRLRRRRPRRSIRAAPVLSLEDARRELVRATQAARARETREMIQAASRRLVGLARDADLGDVTATAASLVLVLDKMAATGTWNATVVRLHLRAMDKLCRIELPAGYVAPSSTNLYPVDCVDPVSTCGVAPHP